MIICLILYIIKIFLKKNILIFSHSLAIERTHERTIIYDNSFLFKNVTLRLMIVYRCHAIAADTIKWNLLDTSR